MRNIILICIILTYVQAFAWAVPDSIIAGPYNISFDIGLTRDDYMVIVKDPVQVKDALGNSTDYSIIIQNNSGFTNLISIDLNRRNFIIPVPSSDELLQIIKIAVNKQNDSVNKEFALRQIDGTQGAISAYETPLSPDYYIKWYVSIYFPKSDNGHTQAIVSSLYPWDRTLLFLRTIHINYTGNSTTSNEEESYLSAF
jgi:hypothetical protein